MREGLGLNRWLRGYVQQYIKPEPGARILDIGCGTGEVVRYLAGTTYVGFDHHPPYIEYAVRIFGDRGRFVLGDVADHLPELEGQFDLVMANGVLHHLNDALAQRAFQLGAAALQKGGRMITVDPCFYDGQSALTKLIVSHDRGEYVRPFDRYAKLTERSFRFVDSSLWAGNFPIPFSVAIVQCRNEVFQSS
jgi:SAM-dependent methyltransferase